MLWGLVGMGRAVAIFSAFNRQLANFNNFISQHKKSFIKVLNRITIKSYMNFTEIIRISISKQNLNYFIIGFL